ncbi:hypothetical protein D3C77_534740 [compost metagenome]
MHPGLPDLHPDQLDRRRHSQQRCRLLDRLGPRQDQRDQPGPLDRQDLPDQHQGRLGRPDQLEHPGQSGQQERQDQPAHLDQR